MVHSVEKQMSEQFPFTWCRTCPDCVLNVGERSIFNAHEERIDVEVIIKCKKESRCMNMFLMAMKHET